MGHDSQNSASIGQSSSPRGHPFGEESLRFQSLVQVNAFEDKFGDRFYLMAVAFLGKVAGVQDRRVSDNLFEMGSVESMLRAHQLCTF